MKILRDGLWGQLCNYTWNDKAANVTCKMMGYRYGVSHGSTDSTLPSLAFWVTDVECTGLETSLDKCDITWGKSVSKSFYRGANRVLCFNKIQGTYISSCVTYHAHRKENLHGVDPLSYFSFQPLISLSSEGRKEMFYLTTHSTHFIYGYMASDIWVKDHSDSEKGNPVPPHRQQGFFYMHHPTDRIAHTTAFVTPFVEHWLV